MADNSAEEFDLDAELAATLREINSRENAEESEDEDIETDVDTSSDNAEVSEDDEPEADPIEAEADETEEDEPNEEPVSDPADAKPQAEVKRAPSSWSAKGKSEFSKLPAHIQDEVLKRENDFHNGIQQYKEKAEIGDRLMGIVQPYAPIIRAKNSTPERTIQSMLDTAYRLETGTPQEKALMLAQVAQEYGADMNSLLQSQEGAEQVPQYVRQLEQQVAQLQQGFTSQQRFAQQQTTAEAQGSIEQFRGELDESGNFKHLYFDDVRDEMADRIDAAARTGRQLSLQEAYDAAIWARPDIRETLLAGQQQAEIEKRNQERAKKAQQAKKRAGTNLTTTGSHATISSEQVGSVDDTLRETMSKIKSRDG